MEECAEDHIQHYTRIEEPHDILNQLNFSQTPQDPHKEPTRSIPTKEGPKWCQKGCGQTPTVPIQAIFHVESPTNPEGGSTREATTWVRPNLDSFLGRCTLTGDSVLSS
jgi:hypothetical protein